jgi:DnaJ-domain-containing protein 1
MARVRGDSWLWPRGFVVISAVIDARRAREDQPKSNDDDTKDDQAAQTHRRENRRSEGKESPPRSWWEVLNVNENAPPEQIKNAFRKEISKYHPDRVEGLGIELRDLAELKAKEVNHAYTLAKKQRRFT